MACGVVALREEDVVVCAALQRLVQRDGLAHELLLDLSEAVKTGLELEVVVGICLSDSRDNGDVVTLGADVVGRRDDSNVDVYRDQCLMPILLRVNSPFLRPTCD